MPCTICKEWIYNKNIARHFRTHEQLNEMTPAQVYRDYWEGSAFMYRDKQLEEYNKQQAGEK